MRTDYPIVDYILTTIALLVFLTLSQGGRAQERKGRGGYPIYEDCSVPVPDKSLKITKDDLQLTDKYLDLYPDGIAYANKEGLRRLYNFYKNDPRGQKEWESHQKLALKTIPTWDISKILTTRTRYMYAFLKMKTLAELYIFTGNELVSDFIRCHLAKAASMPIDFWMHAELRKLDPQKPKGYLESSHISRMLGTVITAVRRNMSEEEIRNIETAWHDRAFVPMLNWLDEPSKGNFCAVISTGVLYAAKYFKDKAAWDRGVWGLRYFVSNGIGKDGSDSEGYAYYAYPAGVLFDAAMIMDENEIRQVFDGADIDKTMTWRLYGQMFEEDERGMTKRISYGDNNYRGITRGAADEPCALSRYIYKDGIAEWIWQTYDYKMSKNIMLLDAKFPGLDVKPVSPSEAGLPLIKAFESGDCFIRSGWEQGSMVLGLKSGDFQKVIRSGHTRAELNSLTLGAYGEYFIVTCGSASYRSKIYKNHDRSTQAANTITIDNEKQVFPGVTNVTRCEQLEDGTYFLRSDVVDAYKAGTVPGCFRSIHYIPEGGFYIVRDYLATKDGLEHRYDYRFHIYNRDEETSISGKPDFIKVTRPAADLYIAMNRKMDLEKKDAYMHGPSSRDYDPDGPNQGKLGSSIELDWSCSAPNLDVCVVLFPAKKNARKPEVVFGDNCVTVNGKKYDFKDTAPAPVDPSKMNIELVFDNAGKFVFGDGSRKLNKRMNSSQTDGTPVDNKVGEFWISDSFISKYKFKADEACNWTGFLSVPSGKSLLLPAIKGYQLASVEILAIKNSGKKKYSVTGAESFILNKADESTASHLFEIKDKTAKEYFVTCAGEMAMKFKLVYEPR